MISLYTEDPYVQICLFYPFTLMISLYTEDT